MSDPTAKIKPTQTKENKMTREQTLRLNELMRLAKDGDYFSNAEFDELAMLMKIRGYH
jgi:hypothetical protein